MKSFILRGTDAMLKQRLGEAGVYFYDFSADAIVIEEDLLPGALRALEATVAEEKESEYEGLYEISLQYTKKPAAAPRKKPAAATASAAPTMDPARAAARQRYIEACSVRLKDAVQSAEQNYHKQRKALPPLQSKFFTLCRQNHVAGDKATDEERRQRFAAEFQRLKETSKVRDIRVTNGALLIYTNMLCAAEPDGGPEHEIGRFIILVRLDGQGNDPVRWFNQTRRVNAMRSNMNAPYVMEDGSPCLSEILETLIQLIAQFELATVADLAIQFVETINDDEPGRHIDKWPLSAK